MPRCSPSAVALMLSLCLLPVAAANAAPEGSVDATTVSPAGADAGFAAQLAAAAEQGGSGDMLGAGIAYERILADPRMATLSASEASEVWSLAAAAANALNQEKLAGERVNQALKLDPGNRTARMMLAYYQLYLGQAGDAADNFVAGIVGSTEDVNLDVDTVWYLTSQLRDTPARSLALLQALFDQGWKPDGIEPAWHWVTLATLQVDAGQRDKVAATLERVDAPLPLVQLHSDKRFDRYLRSGDARFDPMAAVPREIDRLRVASLLSPGQGEVSIALADALVVSGQAEEAIGMTQRLADVVAASRELPGKGQGLQVAAMMDARARAQWQLGRSDDAIETQQLSVRMAAVDDATEQNLRLAMGYISLHRPALARQTLEQVTEVNAHGDGIRQLVQLHAALQLNDTVAAQRARDALIALRAEAPVYYMYGLITDDRLDEASVVLAERLADPAERGQALLDVQDMLIWPELPADKPFNARLERFKALPAVRAAVNKVGRINRYALYPQ